MLVAAAGAVGIPFSKAKHDTMACSNCTAEVENDDDATSAISRASSLPV